MGNDIFSGAALASWPLLILALVFGLEGLTLFLVVILGSVVVGFLAWSILDVHARSTKSPQSR